MRFPESERIHFEKDTIVEMICQLRFPEILSIGTKPPDAFQESVRGEYPLYERQGGLGGAPAEVARILEQLQFAPPEAVTHWFRTTDGDAALSLGPAFIAITVNKYPGWDPVHDRIDRAVTALDAAYGPPFFDRIGLRYRDVIDRDDIGLGDRSWAELLHPGMVTLVGADLGIDPSRDRVVTDALLHLDEPNEAMLHLRHGFGGNSSNTYELDADFYLESRIERGEALALLDNLNHQESNFFRWAIGEDLREALGVRRAEV
jgi:uncharacterized protein (TIGR04255 family)